MARVRFACMLLLAPTLGFHHPGPTTRPPGSAISRATLLRPRFPSTRPARATRSPRAALGPLRASASGGGAAPNAAAAPAAPPPASLVRGGVVIAGGVLAHLILGSMYCWGNFLSYAPPALLYFDGLAHAAARTPDAVNVLPLALVGVNVGMPIGSKLNKAFGARRTTLAGCALMAAGTFAASFQTRLAPFMLFYSGVCGVGTGMAYSTPMIAGWSWFPERKGLVNGLVLFGFGTGAFVFNRVGTGLAAAGVPWASMLRQLAAAYAIFSLAGAAFVTERRDATVPPPPPDADAEDCDVVYLETRAGLAAESAPDVCKAPGAGFREAVRSRRFALLWAVGLLAFTPGLTVLGLYKRFGMADAAMAVANDAFQSRVGGIAAVLSGLGKLLGGQVADRFGFRRGTIANTLLQVSVMLALPFTLQNRTAFAACVCGALFSLGGSISMYVTVNAQTFGVRNAGEIYSLLFSALALASVFGAKLTAALLPSIGWGGVFRLLAAMGVVNLGMLALLKRETAKPAAWDL